MRGVSQISPPIRIFLAVAVLFLVAWMTVLKPKAAEDVSAPTPITTGNVAAGKPAVSAPGKLAEKAKSAVQEAGRKHATTLEGDTATPATGASAGTTAGTTTGAATKSATGAAAPAAATGDLKGLPAAAVKAIKHQKVMVVGFFTAKSADDRAVRQAMLKADRWDGRVMVKAAPIGKVAAWGRIAHGVDVEQSPTVVVVGRDLKATPLVGFVDTQTINQAVVDSLRSAGGLFTSAYLRQVNHVCATASSTLFSSPNARTLRETPGRLQHGTTALTAMVSDLRGIKAPARYKAFKAATVADTVAMRNSWARMTKVARSHPSAAALLRSAVAADARLAPVEKRFDARMRTNHVLSCVNG
jgi:hypothetical protein